MRLAIILSLISVVMMFSAIEFIVNYNHLSYAHAQKAKTDTVPKQINFDIRDRVNSDIQITQLTK